MAQYHQYLPSVGVRFMHRFPRYGHGSDFSKLASSEHEEQTDYIVGILTASYSILSLFIFWGVVIVTCKCMGKHRVGLCAGRVHVTSDRLGSGSCRLPTYLWKLRCAFIIVGCCMILLCAALAGPGLSSIMTTSTSVRNSNINVQDLIAEGLVILDTVDSVKRNIEPLDVSSIMNIEAVCPSFQANLFFPVDSLRSAITAADREFRELKQLLQLSNFEATRQIVDTIWNATEHIDSAVTTVEEHDWIVKMITLFLGGLSFLMILRAVITLSSRHKSMPLSALTEIVILPLFLEALMIIWIATSAMAIASIPTADFCSGNQYEKGPSGSVMSIFEERGIGSDDIIFVTFQYYQSGCVTEDPVSSLYQYKDDLQSGIILATSMLGTMNGIGIDNINRLCGGDVSPIVEGMELINDNLGALQDALRQLASCSKLGPIYSEMLQKTVCAHFAESSTLMFLIMFAISFVGMMMVMIRAAMYPFREIMNLSAKCAGDGFDGSSTKASTYETSTISQSEPSTGEVPTYSSTRRSDDSTPEGSMPREPLFRKQTHREDMIDSEDSVSLRV